MSPNDETTVAKTSTNAALEATGQLPNLAAFLAVVAAGSFTGASRASGIDKTVLSRRVQKLEQVLEVRLLNRTTRSLHVTDAGRRLVEEASEPLGDVILALARAREADVVRGTVRVSTLSALAPLWGDVLGTLRDRFPQLTVQVATSDAFVGLVAQGFDVSVRSGLLPDSSLVAKRLGSWRYVLVASPAWISRHPEVVEPGDLAPHWLLYSDVADAVRWRFEREEGAVDVEMRPNLGSGDGWMLLETCRAGLGVMAVPPFMVEHDLSSGRLVRLLPAWRVGHLHGIWGLLPHRAYVPARAEAVLNAVGEALDRAVPRWEALTG